MEIESVYKQIYKAFRRFNRHLFDNELPPCLIEIHRHRRKERGHFIPGVWLETNSQGEIIKEKDEISLNPKTFKHRTTEEILSTLVHEMCHQFQHHFGKPGKNGYHNREFARIMKQVGLIATETGKEGGKSTGYKVTHYIDQKGVFIKIARKLIVDGMNFDGFAIKPYGKDRSKSKHTCPECEINAWSNKNIKLICGFCQIPMITQS